MIDIYRADYKCKINHFYGRKYVLEDEVVLRNQGSYIYAEPRQKGNWAFGGNLLYTSNGIHPRFNTPIKLHDRNMDLE